jgi:MarR family transcriptional regulator, lower aerobic nicotinate degradation pathway regulator
MRQETENIPPPAHRDENKGGGQRQGRDGGNRRAAEYRLEDQAGFWLRRAYQRHMAIFAGAMNGLDLTSMQFAALAILRRSGPLTQAELGRLTGMDRATMSGVDARLKRRALIVHRPDPKDRRSRLIEMTPAGAALLARAIACTDAIAEATLHRLTKPERRALLAILKKLA